MQTQYPALPSFLVSAPGRVVAFGEHTAVTGRPALLAAISLRSYLLVTASPQFQRTVTLNVIHTGLNYTWQIDSLPWDKFHPPSKKKSYYFLPELLDEDLVKAIVPHARVAACRLSNKLWGMNFRFALAFLYLLLSLSCPEDAGSVYTLRSTIPPRSGLHGSSFCVCVSTSLLLQVRTPSPDRPYQRLGKEGVFKEHIAQWALVGDLCMFGYHSFTGVDNIVSTNGKAVLYSNDASGQSATSIVNFPELHANYIYTDPKGMGISISNMRKLKEDYAAAVEGARWSGQPATPGLSATAIVNFPNLPVLLVDIRNVRKPGPQTKAGEKILELASNHPAAVGRILDAIGQITNSALELISANPLGIQVVGSHTYDVINSLGTLIRMNHGMLYSLELSNPRLERVRDQVDRAGIGWTKPTGSVIGGCAMILLRPDVSHGAVEELERKLNFENLQPYKANIGGKGVAVLWPAIRVSPGGEKREEIDQRMFENAVESQGLLELVGDCELQSCQGWEFLGRLSD